MVTIEEYRKAVEYFASNKRNYNINNEGDEYAKVIFSNIFANASQTVRIAANTLRNTVVDSPEYQNALDQFLFRQGAQLFIIISHLPETAREDVTENIYRRLRRNPAYEEGRIHIKNAESNLFTMDGKPANFCVADGLMYRIEDDIVKRTALCNFGDSSKAVKLEEVFDQGFAKIENELELSQLFA